MYQLMYSTMLQFTPKMNSEKQFFVRGSNDTTETGKSPSPNCCHKLGSNLVYKISLYAVALRLPLFGNMSPSPNLEKTAPDEKYTKAVNE